MLNNIIRKHYGGGDFPIIFHYDITDIGIFDWYLEKRLINESLPIQFVFVPTKLANNNGEISRFDFNEKLVKGCVSIKASDYMPGDIVLLDAKDMLGYGYDKWVVGVLVYIK